MNDPGKNIQFISRLLIAFGVLFVNLYLFSALAEYLCKSIYHISVTKLLQTTAPADFSEDGIRAMRLFQGLVNLGSFGVSAFVISLTFRQKPLEYLGLYTFPKRQVLLLIPVFILVSTPFLSWLLELNDQLHFPESLSALERQFRDLEQKNEDIYETMLRMNGYSDLIINLLVMALLPALGEELFCRGVLLNIFYDRNGRFFRSVVMVALIFTLFHSQIFKFLPMMVLAVILGLFINWTGGIWASVIFHFLNNSLSVAGNFYYQKGIRNIFTDEHISASWIIVLVSFSGSLALIYYLNRLSVKLRNSDHE